MTLWGMVSAIGDVMTLRDKYERETGKKASMHSTGFIATDGYVAWLERELNAAHTILDLCCKAPLQLEIAKQTITLLKSRAECAENLAADIKMIHEKGAGNYYEAIAAALAEYEAACKGGSS